MGGEESGIVLKTTPMRFETAVRWEAEITV